MSNPSFLQQRSNLPEPVRKVLENPSPETARAYVTWSRQTNEKLAKATEYIVQATREMNARRLALKNLALMRLQGWDRSGFTTFFHRMINQH